MVKPSKGYIPFYLILIMTIVVITLSQQLWAMDFTEKEKKVLKETKVIKLVVNTATWREKEKPYDITKVISTKLKDVGFKIVAENAKDYDATVAIKYNEIMGNKVKYTDKHIIYTTKISLDVKLFHNKLKKEIFFKNFEQDPFGYYHFFKCPPLCSTNDLYLKSIEDLTSEPFFSYLGNILLIKLGKSEVDEVSIFISSLKNKNYKIRMKSAEILGWRKDPRAIEPLIGALMDDENKVIMEAFTALEKIGHNWRDNKATKEIVSNLILSLKDKSKWNRERAAEILGRIRDPRAIEPLIGALNDGSKDVRKKIVNALGEFEDRKAIEALYKLEEAELDGDVIKAIESAIKKIQKAVN